MNIIKSSIRKLSLSRKKISNLIIWLVLFLVVLLIITILVNKNKTAFKVPTSPNTYQSVAAEEEIASPYPSPLVTPNKVKGIYMTGYTFSNKKRRTELINLVTETELNSIVIDLKDSAGKLMFQPISEELQNWSISPVALDRDDYKNILDQLQAEEIYTIARITTFQDPTAVKNFPELALKNKAGNNWLDYKGVAWLDMTNEQAWQLLISQSKEAALIGFDEVQFDYIRFPSDGNTSQIKYANFVTGEKKHKTITNFFKYLKSELKDFPLPLSIDLFGLTYQRHSDLDYDLNIGQRLVDAAPYFDFISPMVYPSHYPTGFLAFSNPAEHPYEIVNKALAEGNLILQTVTSSVASTRPWLQDFDLGAQYTASLIKAQIKAADDNHSSGWLLWNAKNIYTVEALEK